MCVLQGCQVRRIDPDDLSGFLQSIRDFDILSARFNEFARMLMNADDYSGQIDDRGPEYFTAMDQDLIQGSNPYIGHGSNLILYREMKDQERFCRHGIQIPEEIEDLLWTIEKHSHKGLNLDRDQGTVSNDHLELSYGKGRYPWPFNVLVHLAESFLE
jgi:hypothetical protein